MEKIEIKRGATLSRTGLFTLPAGTWQASSNVEKSDGSLQCTMEMTVTPLSVPDEDGHTHSVLMVCSAAKTALFEVGTTYLCDIKFTDTSPDPVVLKTDTFGIKTIREVT